MIPFLRAFLTQSSVSLSVDLSSPYSMVSAPVVYTLNLPCIFTASGHQNCSVSLCVPTINGHYRSRLSLVVGYHLPSDVILGNDWVASCQPIILDDKHIIQQPSPSLLSGLLPPHCWYRVPGSLPSLTILPHANVPSSPHGSLSEPPEFRFYSAGCTLVLLGRVL